MSTVNTEEAGVKFRGACLSPPARAFDARIPEGAGGAVLVHEDHLWENGRKLKYGFIPSSGSVSEQKKVHEVIKEWERFANIKFEFVQNLEDATIRIAFIHSQGSWSFVGKNANEGRPSDKPTMNLGGLDDIKKITEKDRGVILHEFGHALGLEHEHQSPMRNEILKMNCEYTIEAFGQDPNYWTKEQVEKEILNVLETKDLTNYTDLDLTSIMMYFMPAAQNDKGIEIKPNNKLSDYDKAFMLIHYPYFGFEPREAEWTFLRALDVLGIQGGGREKILKQYSSGNVRDVRREFAKHYSAVREARNKELAASLAAKA